MRAVVSMGQLKIVSSSAILVGTALGSCVGLMVYDEKNRVAGLAHIMLPSSRNGVIDSLPAKFADHAVPLLLHQIELLVGKPAWCRAKLAGGARMFSDHESPHRYIGARNIEAVRKLLAEQHIPIVAEDIGGDHARTIEFDTATFEVLIKSITHGQRRI